MNELSVPLHLQIDQRETTANTTEERQSSASELRLARS